ncbi:MAG: carboxypeptidase-like regulatory domain-containing protein [Arcicella sp.]|nr:carboxypeptidase-like regulatory domain-containing protein [Arcicella sp.]
MVAGANVLLKGTVRGVQSNNEGNFIIQALPAGEYTVVVSSVGMKTQEMKITLAENESKRVDFKLEDFSKLLNDVEVFANRGIKRNEHLGEVEGVSIHATKKNEVIL